DPPDLLDNFVERLFPRDRNKSRSFFAHERSFKPIRMFILHIALYALGAEASLVEGKIFPGLEADHAIIFDLELNAALLSTEATMRFYDAVGLDVRVPAGNRHLIQCRAELINKICNRYR